MLDLEPNAKYLSNLWEQVANLNYEKFLSDANRFINSYQLTPLQLIGASILSFIILKYAMCIITWTISFLKDFRENIKVTIFNAIIKLPGASHYLHNYQQKMKKEFEVRSKSKRKNQIYKLPDKPMREDTILNRIKGGSEESRKFYTNGGKMSASVFCAQDDHWDFIGQVMRETIESNPLWATEFSSIAQQEAEIIRITLDLHHAPEGACGIAPSGGTESILLAMLAYRQWGKERGITKPNIVVPVTAHGALDKACFYFDIEIRKVSIKADFSVDIEGM